ncbi:MAG TPA: SusC/RagA family TonB-linked outer membrane protein [Puia sp.]|nr:SusC/RagA family TonB-linked outer membrane protein [Puia sp.]
MNRKKIKLLPGGTLLLFFFVLLLCHVQAIAQSRTIRGKITDETGGPVAGASVTAGTAGVSTHEDGTFELTVPSGVHFLVISHIGFTPQQVDIHGKEEISVKLTKEDKNSLNDVVVVGYGTARKKDVTGAVASISEKDFNQGVITDPVLQIQGKVAGLVITQPNGDPNGDLIIRLRGQASLSGGQTPLIVVDGVPLDNANQLQNIPPGDIASYDILKDASAAAIYGSRGANGVIIINTKRAGVGKPHLEYTGTASMEKIAKSEHLLSATQYKEVIPSSALSAFDKGGNTDWWNAMMRTGSSQNHVLSLSGTSNTGFSYRGSVSYLDQQGIVINTGKTEVGVRLNAEQKALNDRLVVQIGILNTHVTRKYIDYQLWQVVNNSPPTYPVYNPDGSYFQYYSQDVYNPVAAQSLETNGDKETFSQLYGTVNYELLKGFKIGAAGDLHYFNTETQYYQPVLPGVGNVNSGNQAESDADSRRGELHANYAATWGKNNFAATGVYEYNYYTTDNFSAAGTDYLIDQLGANALQFGNAQLNAINSYKDETKLISFLGRVTYNYDSRYYLTASFRRDGSSKFGVDNRWGDFPSASAAWRISQENFARDISWLNELKLSAGYGVTGNQDAITPYNTLLTLSSGSRYYDAVSGTYPVSYSVAQNPNPYLQWEEVKGRNVGLNFSVLNFRLNGDINVYNNTTDKLLFDYSVPTPPFFVSTILANVGTMSNKGVEIQLNGDIVRKKDFTWNLSGQITFIQTRIVNLSGNFDGVKLSTNHIGAGTDYTYNGGGNFTSAILTYLQVGYSPYVFFLPHEVGVRASDGRELFADGKGGTVISDSVTDAMRNYIDPAPKFTYGFTNTFTYKNWNLNIFMRGVYGEKIYNNTEAVLNDNSRLPGKNVLLEAVKNGIQGVAQSDRWLEPASFLRLDNMTLGYTIRNMKGFENFRVFVTGSNLWVITRYEGLDPEIRNGDAYLNRNYIDLSYGADGYYPRSRSVAIGLNFGLK